MGTKNFATNLTQWQRYALEPHVETVILTALWSNPYLYAYADGYVSNAISDFVLTVRDAGKKVILLGEIPTFPSLPPKCNGARIQSGCNQSVPLLTHLERSRNQMLRRLAFSHANVSYWDVLPHLCDDGACHVIRNGVKYFVDGFHLSIGGLGPILDAIRRKDGGMPFPMRAAFESVRLKNS